METVDFRMAKIPMKSQVVSRNDILENHAMYGMMVRWGLNKSRHQNVKIFGFSSVYIG